CTALVGTLNQLTKPETFHGTRVHIRALNNVSEMCPVAAQLATRLSVLLANAERYRPTAFRGHAPPSPLLELGTQGTWGPIFAPDRPLAAIASPRCFPPSPLDAADAALLHASRSFVEPRGGAEPAGDGGGAAAAAGPPLPPPDPDTAAPALLDDVDPVGGGPAGDILDWEILFTLPGGTPAAAPPPGPPLTSAPLETVYTPQPGPPLTSTPLEKGLYPGPLT
ncbi:hypothetical protein BDK51DRAFT_29635, partial [Blyttiomyces helicus]